MPGYQKAYPTTTILQEAFLLSSFLRPFINLQTCLASNLLKSTNSYSSTTIDSAALLPALFCYGSTRLSKKRALL